MIPKEVLSAYGIDDRQASIQPVGQGLINHTWLVNIADRAWVLQEINHQVFTDPGAIDRNIAAIAHYLRKQAPGYFLPAPLPAKNGQTMVSVASPENGNRYYRILPFVEGSHTITTVTKPEQAFAAAAAFGGFTKLLSGYPAESLEITLPDFHNLLLRYEQFQAACKTGNPERYREALRWIDFLSGQTDLVEEYKEIVQHPDFHIRVTHHDTKISNVLFDAADEVLCVIDLDTVMPGYFISDVGDMMRTYLPTVSEEEKDLSRIQVRESVYEAIVHGYAKSMGEELTAAEKEHFFFAGTSMIYMQAIRFLTDYLAGDVYYGQQYEGQNLVRASNQCVLLQRLFSLTDRLTRCGN
ncbi:MAG TPA: aminoglycoside phosphotransferase family protein [Sediminibacterium sp.]|nr:aminoglycoside phosphotransferase family protein [Sediminibacterium sp.]